MLRLGKEQEARHHPLLEADGIFLSLSQVGDAAWGHRGIPQGPEFILTRLEETDTVLGQKEEGGDKETLQVERHILDQMNHLLPVDSIPGTEEETLLLPD